MKTIIKYIRWTFNLSNIIFFSLLFVWKYYNIDLAGTIFSWYYYFCCFSSALGLILDDCHFASYVNRRGYQRIRYELFTYFIVIGIAVSYGFIFSSIFFLLGQYRYFELLHKRENYYVKKSDN